MDIKKTIESFDNYLAQKGEHFDAVIVGGAALNLLSVTSRVTQDIDVLDPGALPQKIKAYAEDFAKDKNLPPNWLNTGPADLVNHLPDGWQDRKQPVFSGKAINLETLGADELLLSKCWAYLDRERDKEDIISMKPSEKELEEVAKLIKPLDAHPDWPKYVDQMFEGLKKECSKDKGMEI